MDAADRELTWEVVSNCLAMAAKWERKSDPEAARFWRERASMWLRLHAQSMRGADA